MMGKYTLYLHDAQAVAMYIVANTYPELHTTTCVLLQLLLGTSAVQIWRERMQPMDCGSPLGCLAPLLCLLAGS